ncbi:Tubulin/FtsZ, GTPase domain-containing protein, partial [Coemansia spiralis]
MREIITLQFGENANYVGTHYWNMVQHQNSTETDGQTNTSVLFSEQSGDRSKQERRPRVLIFDKVDSFGSLGRDALQSAGEDTADQESALWGGQTEVYRQQLYAKPTLPQTQSPDDDSVADGAGDSYERRIRYWSDFNELKYDSRSFNSVSGVEFGNSIGELNTFLEGMQVFAGEDGRDDVLEGNLRVFAEESDYLQGFQVFADAVGGFAGYGSAFMAKARDEFPKTPILLY